MWSWYMDERAIVDPTNGKILVSGASSSPVAYPTGRPTGSVEMVTYDYATGRRTRYRDPAQSTLTSYGLADIEEDDHNAPGITILPDGRYLAMYSNHGNTAMGDYFSRYRISTNPHDSSSWSAEQNFDWRNVTGWNVNPNANNRVSYHNLHYLPADNGGAGRLYDFSRGTHQSANALIFNPNTNAWSWGGQLTTSSAGGYSTGYIKYASNGSDRIYFLSTETHPRNFNNNLWAGYVSDGKTYDMAGNVVDANLFDNENTAGVGVVPDINKFTNVRLADGNTLVNPNANSNANGPGTHRLWTVDLAVDGSQNPVGMYIGRHDVNAVNPGGDTNPIDHRIFYARWDGSSWQNHELARMGDRLYRGTDKSEQDYTGLGALVPGDPNTVFISTPYDPRDPAGATVTPSYEIYKGITGDFGANWSWTAVTSNSSVDNLRPIVPAWDQNHRAVLWFRGAYTTAQNTDAAVVGLVEQNDTQAGLVHYVDANSGNTTLDNGAPISGWTTDASTGNGGSVLSATTGVTGLKTQLSGLTDGQYDVFTYFWANQTNDWRIQAGLDPSAMQLYRDNGAQQAEAAQFDGPVTLTGGGGFLYRAYLGRADVEGGSSIDVFVDDFLGSTNTRTWYDGVGYAQITPLFSPIPGDFDGNRFVDDNDLAQWHLDFGVDAGSDADGDGDSDGDDLLVWQANYGLGKPPEGSGVGVPEPASHLLCVMSLGFLTLAQQRI